jgi:hypothetical protein
VNKLLQLATYSSLCMLLSILTNKAAAEKKISLLTCGPGTEVYSVFGHSALRITDSSVQRDDVYNYGMFDFSAPGFVMNYVRGKLLYFGARQSFYSFAAEYAASGRSVSEQILNLSPDEAEAVELALLENEKPENFYYKYDFCFKNCSTKLRDLLKNALGNRLLYRDYMPQDSVTFIGTLNTYLQQQHWLRVGIDVILSSKVHARMNSFQSMFLPRGLALGFDNATIGSQPLVQQTNVLLPSQIATSEATNVPLYSLLLLSVALILLSKIYSNQRVMQIVDLVFFTAIGLLGCFFMFMWLGTDHVQTKHNLHMLWAMPTHLAWGHIRRSRIFIKYCQVAMLFSTLLLTIVHFTLQAVPFEIFSVMAYTIFRLFQHAMAKEAPRQSAK